MRGLGIGKTCSEGERRIKGRRRQTVSEDFKLFINNRGHSISILIDLEERRQEKGVKKARDREVNRRRGV